MKNQLNAMRDGCNQVKLDTQVKVVKGMFITGSKRGHPYIGIQLR